MTGLRSLRSVVLLLQLVRNLVIRIRKADPSDAGAIARVHVDTWRTAYAGILPAAFLAGLSFAEREAMWSQALTADRPTTCMVVAETDGGVVVGFAYGAPEREGNPQFRGELFAIYVLRDFQRRGIGQRLYFAMVHHFSSQGIESMLLWVLKDNHPARHFYESMGGEYVEEKTITIGGTDLVEVAYGWRDLTDLTVR